ncbi:putative major head subunit protein [Labilithrix luteola]|uniref:Putative major head subunit protein n=1 Tax=Labilithrix luteola TaxID=1391654 RepID=A0A0K1QBY5_9BACT|nr:Mu-like prophage major head subunit gpT family protein [Labilithrix luteola]AKV03187.1 putative major head subunit protein [Labilithrix luteola]
MQITPTWIGNFETNLRTLINGSSEYQARNLFWDKYMSVQQSATLRELFFFIIEAAQIRNESQGGNKRFDDMSAAMLEIVNENFGDGLILTKNEINDNVMANPGLGGVSAMKFAESWARQIGAAATRWPQDLLFQLLASGESANGYDNVPFFSTAHPVHLYRSSAGVFANLFTGAEVAPVGANAGSPGKCPIDVTNAASLDTAAANLWRAVAYIQALKGPNGKPRNLRVRRLLCGTGLTQRAIQVVDTKMLTANGIENVLSRYQIEVDSAAELPANSVDYYLACEMVPGLTGPTVLQQREPFTLTSFTPDTQVELARKKVFQWDYDGRGAGAYGMPELIFKVKAT